MTDLSVIIPTCNRPSMLRDLLDKLKEQTLSHEEFEILVIDNGSSDDTRRVAELFFSVFKNIRYYFEEKPGLHEARHRGMHEASSDILVYCDDDIEPFPTWLDAIRDSFRNPDAILVGGRILPRWECPPPFWIRRMWERRNHWGRAMGHLSVLDFGDERREIDPRYVWGCNYSIRKSVLREAGGFHPDAMPEHLTLYRGDGESGVNNWLWKNGQKAWYEPRASVFHRIPASRMTLKYFMRRSFLQGISDSYTALREEKKA